MRRTTGGSAGQMEAGHTARRLDTRGETVPAGKIVEIGRISTMILAWKFNPWIDRVFAHAPIAPRRARASTVMDAGKVVTRQRIATRMICDGSRRSSQTETESQRACIMRSLCQIAKVIGAMAVALVGRVNVVVPPGGVVRGPMFSRKLVATVRCIARVISVGGRSEMESPAAGQP